MRLPSTEAYRLWAPGYDSTPNPLLALEERLISQHLGGFASGTVLDIGCGTGRSMAGRFNARASAFGADLSIEMLRQAGQKDAVHGRVVLAEAAALPFANAIADLTMCSFAISYFSDAGAACSEIGRVTKRSGLVVISDLHPLAAANGWSRSFRVGNTRYEIDHSNYSPVELDALLSQFGLQKRKEVSAGFSEQERTLFLHAGKGHLFEEAARIPAIRLAVYRKR